MESACAKVRVVRKVIRRKGKDELPKRGSRQARGQSSRMAHVDVEAALALPSFRPAEFEAMINDTIGQWTLWTGSSPGGRHRRDL